ncbi:lipopolysaccharide export system protein LptA [Nicoletella semolina]|uniref:Lipopolysaccharide export system protein LptA n=1 Tax=Nicoletella semolina TaxID=271160 RepID=A0A4R2N4V8_9PAST|nr:lipopolysaccharide transport periplasmic protein LptA [Nicoletella semolina]MDH2924104.1 lipopolysaccharide transport periplasmic protein LptA [Nicoletella semolina]TCP15892.1 lipopolysaccharide export system protein LptA [Nicoletella semolina]
MKATIKSLFLVVLSTFSGAIYALKSDTSQPINVHSGSQSLDIEKNIVTFSDNVLITQGSIKINAAKVVIIRQEGKKEKIEAMGSPVIFEQTLDDGKRVEGRANQISYDLGAEFLTLTGRAELKQLDSFIQAEKITYSVKKQQLNATSSNKSRVKTVLMPTQFQEKKSQEKKK